MKKKLRTTYKVGDESKKLEGIKRLSIGIGIVLLIGIAGLAIVSMVKDMKHSNGVEGENITVVEKPYSGYLEQVLVGYPDCPKKQDRGYLPRKMFCDLPDMPDNFRNVKVLVEHKMLTDLSKVNESYWKQPEFLANWDGLLYNIQHPPEDRFGAQGFLTYPNEAVKKLVKEDNRGYRMNSTFIVYSGVWVIFYQGIKIKAKIEPSDASEYIKVKVFDDERLIEPCFPVYKENCIQKVVYSIEVEPDIPVGEYKVNVHFVKPSDEKHEGWVLQYLNKYTDSGFTSIGRPWHTTTISVVESEG